jgi:hypothetical protein
MRLHTEQIKKYTMARTTKSNKYEGIKKNNPLIVMKTGGATKKSVAEMNYSERSEYINKKYIPHLKSADMYFMIYSNGFSYDYKDKAKSKEQLLKYYSETADYTEANLDKDTNYKVNDWELVRKEYDPETNEVIEEHELEEKDSGNTYNSSYLGLTDLNWRLYHDADYDKWFYVIHPHVGGDIRGNYGDAFILEGDDKEELFYRFYEGFVSGMATISLEFNDGSKLTFDSEQDSDVFNFIFQEENSEYSPKSIGAKFINDFKSFKDWRGDEFLEETVDKFIAEKGQIEKKSGGGAIGSSDAPRAYVQILGYGEGQWMDVERGDDFLQSITDWMDELNAEKGGNREEWEISDWDGFGQRYYQQYMSESDFDEVMDAYDAFEKSDYSIDVIEGYMNDTRISDMQEAISDMDEKYLGAYSSLSDMAYQMVQEGVYTPSMNDMFVTDTDKRIIAGEEADVRESDMSFEDALEYADLTDEYETKKSVIEDEISERQSKLDDLEQYLKDAEGDDYDVTTESISDIESEIIDLESDLSRLDDDMEKEAREQVREIIYDEIYKKLERDLEGFLSDYGYEDYSEVSFVTIDYDAVGEELSADYTVIDDDGKKFVFNNYEGGGKVILLGKPNPKYTHYVVEMNSKKIISAWENKSDANDDKKRLTESHKKSRFSVYEKSTVKNKYGLDTDSYKDWMDIKELSNGSKVAVRKQGEHPKNTENVDAHARIINEINQLKAKKKKVNTSEKKDIEQQIALLKKKAIRLKAKNYIDTGTFSLGGITQRVKVGASHVKRGAIKGGSWIKDQWNEADFGDGKGKAKFDVGGDISDMYHIAEYGEGGAVKSKKIITEKIGFNETATDYLVGLSEKFSVWLADAILKQEMKSAYGGFYEDKANDFGGGYIKIDNDKVAKKAVIEWQKNQLNFVRARYGNQVRLILDWLQHPFTPKQNLRELTFDDAVAKAREWHEELQVLGGDIDYVEPKENTIITEYPTNKEGVKYYWVAIPSNFCPIESSRMGHCGRTGYGNELWSLRSVKPYGKGYTVSDSHVTIAYNSSDGKFYQTKGKKNQKPSEKYFDYIFDLIKISAEKGLFSGFKSEYQSSEDYGFSDMTDAQIRELNEKYPDVFEGFAGQVYLFNAGIISKAPSTIATISKPCDYVGDLLDISRDLRDDFVPNILCGDTNIEGNWSYYYENYSDLIDMLDKKNEERVIDEIARITSYPIEQIKENGIKFYLDNEDEDFDSDMFDNIVRSMVSAMSRAEEDAYHQYYYKEIKNALEELGTVEKLTDEGVVLLVDLSDKLTLEEISNYLDEGVGDLEDVFFEAQSQGAIDLPKLRIDDRWTPYVSDDDFNDIFSDGDLEEGYAKGGKVKKYAKGGGVDVTAKELNALKSIVQLGHYGQSGSLSKSERLDVLNSLVKKGYLDKNGNPTEKGKNMARPTYSNGGGVGSKKQTEVWGYIKSDGEQYLFSSKGKGLDSLMNYEKIDVLQINDYDGGKDFFIGYGEQTGKESSFSKKSDGRLFFGKWNNGFIEGQNGNMLKNKTITYDNGGSVKDDLGLSKKQQEKIFQLPYESAVYVPSTQDVDKVVSIDEMNKRTTDVKKFLSEMFGGYTSSETVGGFIDSKGVLVNEEIQKVTSFSTKEAFESNKQDLLKKLSSWAKEWGQEAIGFEFEGQLYYVPENFKKGGLTPLQQGIKVEMEHKGTLNKIKTGKYSTREGAKMIAKDHLKERKDYYDVVKRVGLKNGGGVEGYEDLYSSSVKGLMKLQKMSDQELLNEANTISYYERMDDNEPEITDVDEAKKYLIDYYSDIDDESAEPFKRGGELWIQDAVDRMKKKGTVGAFTKQAKTHKMNPVRFAKVVLNNPKKYTQKTRRRAQFVKNTNPEKF